VARRALVTGASGFVGSGLARRLLADGHEVTLITRPGSRTWRVDPLRDDALVLNVDLRDPAAVLRAVTEARAEWVFHAAAHGGYSWQRDMHGMVGSNVGGTANLLEACTAAGFEALVHAGSSSEYGAKDHAPAEDEMLDPNSEYAVTKAACTHLCRYVARRDGAQVVTLRLYSVYGPREDPRRLIPTLIRSGLGGTLPRLADPDTARDFVYLDDALDAFLLAAERPVEEPGAIFNVGSGRQTTLREVVDVARRVMGIEAEPRWGSMEARSWDTGVWVADSRKIRGELGWEPRVGLEEGFRRTLEWLRGDPALLSVYAAGD
jgi:UDP-glucose 4-epimerase